MITIVHGDDVASSRNFLHDVKTKFPDTLSVDGSTINVTDLMQMLDGGGLFVSEKAVIIEHFYAKRKAKKEFDALITYLQDKTLDYEIFLWEPKELDKKSLSVFKLATVKTYKLPQTLFLFLDSLKPRQGEHLVKLFHKVLQTTDAEMVFFMLIRQIRLLLALSERSAKPIDEVKRIAPWQQNKLQKQSSLFPQRQLVTIHQRLFEIDKGMKTGELNMSLTQAIDILLIGI